MSNQKPQAVQKPHNQKPRPKKPQTNPTQNAPFFVDRTAERIRRWKLAGVTCFVFSILSSLCWLAQQTGDITHRLACPIIIICHIICAGSVLCAWLRN